MCLIPGPIWGMCGESSCDARCSGGGSAMVRGDEAPELARDCVAVFGGATTGAVSVGCCGAARASSASERARRLPSSDAGRRTKGTGAPSGLASTGASCR